MGMDANGTGVVQERGPQANFHHLTTSLGLFDGHAVVVGSAADSSKRLDGNKRVEIMKGNQWNPLKDFPLMHRRKIWYYSMVTFKEKLYLFGGLTDNQRALAGAYKFSSNGINYVPINFNIIN